MGTSFHPLKFILFLLTLPLLVTLLLRFAFASIHSSPASFPTTSSPPSPPSPPSPSSSFHSDFLHHCLSFAPQSLDPSITFLSVHYVPGNSTIAFSIDGRGCARPGQRVSVSLCRVAFWIETSDNRRVEAELWLPKEWSGRFVAVGNGGLDGCIHYEDMAYTTLNGFAAVGSNNGHVGTSGIDFYENPDALEDFAWRALHTSVISGKHLAQEFYGKAHSKSYFYGCSLGGRQGIRSAEMFPNDFNGIVAGAPAVDFNNLVSWRASFFPITGAIGSPNFIYAPTWTDLIHNEILKQCDGIDGLMDGILEDPDLCHFDPETLLCSSDESNVDIPTSSSAKCLTVNQIEQLRKIFNPLYSAEGELLFPAMQPGSEIMAATGLYAGKPFSNSEDWFRYVVYNNKSWDASTFDLAAAARADSLNPSNIRTWPIAHDLYTFKYHGGKIISYHGTQDDKITSFNSERFFRRLLDGIDSTLDEESREEQLAEFYRHFRISGMFHCNSGPGAWVIGQQGSELASSIGFDPERNVLAALVEWVENGRKPEWIEGTKFVDDMPKMGVQYRRRHCRYPSRNTYVAGDPNVPGSWECVR